MLVPSNYTVLAQCCQLTYTLSSFVLNTCTVCVVYMYVCVCVCMCVYVCVCVCMQVIQVRMVFTCVKIPLFYGMPSLIPQAPPLQNTNIEVVQVGRA